MGRNKRPGSLLSGLPASVLSSLSSAAATAGNAFLTGTKRPPDPDAPSESRPTKKQKLEGLLGPGWEKYDATNVVPFYRTQKEVPERLRKCELCVCIFRCARSHPRPQIFISESAISHCMTRAASWTRKDGTVLPQKA